MSTLDDLFESNETIEAVPVRMSSQSQAETLFRLGTKLHKVKAGVTLESFILIVMRDTTFAVASAQIAEFNQLLGFNPVLSEASPRQRVYIVNLERELYGKVITDLASSTWTSAHTRLDDLLELKKQRNASKRKLASVTSISSRKIV